MLSIPLAWGERWAHARCCRVRTGVGLGKGVEWWQHKAFCVRPRKHVAHRHVKRAWSAAMHAHHLQDMDREQIQSGARSAEGLHKRSGRREGRGAHHVFRLEGRCCAFLIFFPLCGMGTCRSHAASPVSMVARAPSQWTAADTICVLQEAQRNHFRFASAALAAGFPPRATFKLAATSGCRQFLGW